MAYHWSTSRLARQASQLSGRRDSNVVFAWTCKCQLSHRCNIAQWNERAFTESTSTTSNRCDLNRFCEKSCVAYQWNRTLFCEMDRWGRNESLASLAAMLLQIRRTIASKLSMLTLDSAKNQCTAKSRSSTFQTFPPRSPKHHLQPWYRDDEHI